MRAKCFRSMKKNEEPHRLHVVFKRQNEGQGLCHHVIGLMYTLAHCKMLGLKSVPPVLSKTSKPQVNFSLKLFRKVQTSDIIFT